MSNDKKYLTAKRYAQALIDIANDEKISYIALSTDLAVVLSVLKNSKEVFDVLTNPLVNISDKEAIVEKIFERDIDLIVINFLKLLINKNRFDLIYEIIDVYNLLLDEVNKIARVEIISAVELDDTEKLKISDKLKDKLQQEISIKYEIDKSIIAGLIVKYGDKVADMSLAHKLDEYKVELVK